MISKNDGGVSNYGTGVDHSQGAKHKALMLVKSMISLFIVTLVTYTLHYLNMPPTHPILQLPNTTFPPAAKALLFPAPTSARHNVSIWPASRSGLRGQKKKTASTTTYSGPRMSSRQLLRLANPRDA